MSNYKLTYFDIDGGRAEPLRIALHAAGLAFEDIRWSFQEFGEKRETAPFNAVPFMEIDGEIITQSNALCRYVGKMSNLYPEDPLQALYCDEVLDALEDITHYMVQTFGLEGDELITAREKFMNRRLSVSLKGLDVLLKRGGGEYFANKSLTIADLKTAVYLKNIRAGGLDHVPADFVDSLVPALAELQDRVEKDPIVVAYYASKSN